MVMSCELASRSCGAIPPAPATLQITDEGGTTISGIEPLRDAPWHSVIIGQGDGGRRVAIKLFRPPLSLREDPSRTRQIAKERMQLLIAAQLQKEVGDSGARGWLPIRRISEEAEVTYAIMEKRSGSVEGLIEHRVQASSSLLYSVAWDVLIGLEELWQRKRRSHENLKPSNILESTTGAKPRYCLSDPAPKGMENSANDLFALGGILFELVEHKEFSAVSGRICRSVNWERLGPKATRWVEFCEFLLNPAGCQAALCEVRHKLARLGPLPRRARWLVMAAVACAVVIAVTSFAARAIHHTVSAAPAATVHRQELSGNSPRLDLVHFSPVGKTPFSDSLVPTMLAADSRYGKAAAKAALRNKNYKTAVLLLERLAQDGDAAGMTEFGWLYENGLGVERNLDTARRWYRRAAGLDEPDAMVYLGRMYAGEPGIPVVYAEALTWYRKAADLGNAKGMYSIGCLYEFGWGVERDHDAALTWFRKAMAAGLDNGSDSEEVRCAGVVYQHGWAGSKSYPEALRRYREAAERDNAAAMANLSFLYANGLGIGRDCAQAMTWSRRAADLGDPDAMAAIGELYGQGLGVAQDQGQAMRWYRRAADLGSAWAMVRIGDISVRAEGTDRDYVEAMKWYREAADLGSAEGQFHVGALYQDGRGVPHDYTEAMKWYRKAADSGSAAAMDGIGILYQFGLGVTQDHAMAVQWYRRAADMGSTDGLLRLEALSQNGRGASQNPAQAMK